MEKSGLLPISAWMLMLKVEQSATLLSVEVLLQGDASKLAISGVNVIYWWNQSKHKHITTTMYTETYCSGEASRI